MTSTEFTVGLDGKRISSKVLKPPGGGSSDIFGLGGSQFSSSNGTNEKQKNGRESSQSRLFGISSDNSTPTKPNRMQSTIFENENNIPAPRSVKKRYVHRNPITGEETEFNQESNQKAENNDIGENGEDVKENENRENDGDIKEIVDKKEIEEEKMVEIPSKPVQTSIRVKNPPGGKSSGIFF